MNKLKKKNNIWMTWPSKDLCVAPWGGSMGHGNPTVF